MNVEEQAIAGEGDDPRDWRGRIIERSVARSERAIRERGIGPAARIVEAAIALSAETNGAPFSIQQVVTRADTALQTFYRHFGSKDALLLAMLEESIASSVQSMDENASRHANPLDALRYVVTDSFRRISDGETGPYQANVSRDHYRLLELFPSEVERATSTFTDLVVTWMTKARDAGLIESDDIPAQADLIMNLVLSQFHRIRLGSIDVSPEEMAERCWQFCYRALQPRGTKRAAPARPRRTRQS